MSKSNLDYLSNFFIIEKESNIITKSFVDETIESEFQQENAEQERFKIKAGLILIMIEYSLVGFNTFIGHGFIIKFHPLLIFALLFDFFLLLIQLRILSTNSNKLNFTKFMRFIVFYVTNFYSIIINLDPKDGEPVFFVFFMMVYMVGDLFQMFFLDYNIIYMIIIFLIGVLNVIILGLTKEFKEMNIYPLIVPNTIYLISMFLYKKSHTEAIRSNFFSLYKSRKIIESINKMMDDLNLYVINVNKDNVNYYNQRFAESGIIDVQNNDIESQIFNYFESLKYTDNDYDADSTNENKSLFTMIIEKLVSSDSTINIFEKIGQFSFKNSDSIYDVKSYEIHLRKSIFHGDRAVIDVIIYDLTNIKLFEKKIIESKYKQKILSKIAHEFKTPLITISTLVDRIAKIQNINLIHSQLKHINNLSSYTIFCVSDIIQYVSDSINDIKINKEIVNIKELITQVYYILETLIECNEKKKGRVIPMLEIEEDVNLFDIISDEFKLIQVLLNLSSNSVKFTSKGEIKIKASMDHTVNKVKISVKDSGVGIANEYEDIFKTKFSSRQTMSTDEKSGIGLTLSKNLLDLLDHKIEFKRRKNGGTTFSIFLDITNNSNITVFKKIKSIDSNIINKDHIVKSNSIVSRLLRKIDSDASTILGNYNLCKPQMTVNFGSNDENITMENFNFSLNSFHFEPKFSILIVDDVKYVRDNTCNLISQLLQEMKIDSYKILFASDGIELLELLRRDQIEDIKIFAIFVDENMEYMNGSVSIKVIRDLEKAQKFKKYKIFSVTAYEDSETRNNISKSNPDDILMKPCSKSNLRKIFDCLKP